MVALALAPTMGWVVWCEAHVQDGRGLRLEAVRIWVAAPEGAR